ncbi:hypothetical protein L1987_01379 [Smallanthus sonchifolius]|uniref:Uncharacterized protein n=1 Tax=Smallanthus sonchifolius TaxID=185202 RepID=A0ACB9K518_9ASTR|nr:hypothetical protein L1987_01379 [Smallanthus sonchifolius]
MRDIYDDPHSYQKTCSTLNKIVVEESIDTDHVYLYNITDQLKSGPVTFPKDQQLEDEHVEVKNLKDDHVDVTNSPHILAWSTYLYYNRSSDARWSILPPWMEVSLRNGVSMVDFGDGSYEPYPSLDGLEQILLQLHVNDNHRALSVFDLKQKKVLVYDSLRPKNVPGDVKYNLDFMNASIVQWLGLLGYFDEREEFKEFEVVIPTDVPQQVGTKYCGLWVCIFMERIIKGQPLFIPCEDPVAKADQFRTNLATLLFKHIVSIST